MLTHILDSDSLRAAARSHYDAEAVELNERPNDDPFAGLLTSDEEEAQRRSNEAYRDALARRPSNRRHGVQEAA